MPAYRTGHLSRFSIEQKVMIQHRNIVLEAEGVSKSYPAQDEKDQMIEVLKSVDISVHQSEIAAIIGSSGSGKSTLLNIMGGLDRPDAGQIYWNRSSINDWTSDKLAEERNRQVGFIFQFHHLLPEFKIGRASCRERVENAVCRREVA